MVSSYVASIFFLGSVSASANGLMYECDSEKLASEDVCIFVATAVNDIGGAHAHNINYTVAASGFRKVQDRNGLDLNVTPQPWTNGDKLAASTTALTGDLLGYAKAFEMMAPLRDAMMYDPMSLDDVELWNKLTRPFVDCHIKEENVQFVNDKGEEKTAYGVDGVYEKLLQAGGVDTHHYILQFLEEGAIDLVCLMTSLSMDRCDEIRATNGLIDSLTSDCMEAAYTDLFAEHADADSSDTSDPLLDDLIADGDVPMEDVIAVDDDLIEIAADAPTELPAPAQPAQPAQPAGPPAGNPPSPPTSNQGQMMPPQQGGRGGRRRL